MSHRLAYCTNVHAGSDLATTLAELERHARRVASLVGGGAPLGIGLWLSATSVAELRSPGDVRRLRERLADWGLEVATFNAFPYGDFHGERVKHAVYEPHWARPERYAYTARLAEIAVDLVPEGTRQVSLSTLPIGWRAQFTNEGCAASAGLAAAQLERLAERLGQIEAERGVRVTVDLEPEPGCLLDRAQHVVDLFDQVLRTEACRTHLGVCHDICHAAVMFEPQEEALATYARAGIAVHKIQVSNALSCDGSPAALAELARFDEPRYLHQTSIRDERGTVMTYDDLPAALADRRPGERRTHFHVPLHVERIGALGTTQDEIRRCLALFPTGTGPILEIETYAWNVLPAALRPAELADGIACEWRWLAALLEARRP